MTTTQLTRLEQLRLTTIRRKLDEGKSLRHLKRTYNPTKEELALLDQLPKLSVTREYIEHPLDGDVCHSLLQAHEDGQLFSDKAEANLRGSDFDEDKLAVKLRWTDEDVLSFADRLVGFVAERIKEGSPLFQESCAELLSSSFFDDCCTLAGLDADRYRESLSFKMKQLNKH